MTGWGQTPADIRRNLDAARNFLADARQVQLHWDTSPPDARPDSMGGDFRSIERQVSQLRVRRWEAIVAKLEQTASFLGV